MCIADQAQLAQSITDDVQSQEDGESGKVEEGKFTMKMKEYHYSHPEKARVPGTRAKGTPDTGRHSRRALSEKPCLDMLDVTEVCSRMTVENEHRRDALPSGSRFEYARDMQGVISCGQDTQTRPTTGMISCPSDPFERDRSGKEHFSLQASGRAQLVHSWGWALTGVAQPSRSKSRTILMPVRPGA